MDKNNRDYTNGEITVHWKPGQCIHATICYTRLKKVFDPSKKPWVNMDGASTDKIIEIVKKCPTDALTFTRNEDLQQNIPDKEIPEPEGQEEATRIQIMKDGPTIVSGNFVITDINGSNLAKADTVALCRCGNSNNMPFCDGTHNSVSFREKR